MPAAKTPSPAHSRQLRTREHSAGAETDDRGQDDQHHTDRRSLRNKAVLLVDPQPDRQKLIIFPRQH